MKIAIGFLLLFLIQLVIVLYKARKIESSFLLALLITSAITAIEVLIAIKLAVPLAALKYVFQ